MTTDKTVSLNDCADKIDLHEALDFALINAEPFSVDEVARVWVAKVKGELPITALGDAGRKAERVEESK